MPAVKVCLFVMKLTAGTAMVLYFINGAKKLSAYVQHS